MSGPLHYAWSGASVHAFVNVKNCELRRRPVKSTMMRKQGGISKVCDLLQNDE